MVNRSSDMGKASGKVYDTAGLMILRGLELSVVESAPPVTKGNQGDQFDITRCCGILHCRIRFSDHRFDLSWFRLRLLYQLLPAEGTSCSMKKRGLPAHTIPIGT